MSIDSLLEQRFGNGWDAAVSPATEDNDTIKLLLQHRTQRAYEARPVADDVLNAVLAGALSAPSKSDLQQASIIMVKDQDRREQLATLIPSMPWIADAPVFMVFLADGYRIRLICEQRGKPFANDNLDNFLSAVSDASLVLGNCITAAEALGLGCCPISVLRNHIEQVSEILELPARVVPLAGLCIGYPAREGFVSMRLPPSVTVHQDRYDTRDTLAGIDAYDASRDERFSTPAERQKYQDDYGIAKFYGWSEDKARQMSKPERTTVGQFARARGFSLD